MSRKRNHHCENMTSDSESSLPTIVLPSRGRRIDVDNEQDNINDSAGVSTDRLKETPNIIEHLAVSSTQSSRKRRLADDEDTAVSTKRLKLQASSEDMPARQKRKRTGPSYSIANALSETAEDLTMAMTRLANAIERLCFLLATNFISTAVKDICAAVAKCMQGVEVLRTLLPNQDTIPATCERLSNIAETSVTAHLDTRRKRPRKSKQLSLSSASQRSSSSRIQSTVHAAEIWGAAEDQVLRALTPNHLAAGRVFQERFGFDILVEKIHDMLFDNELA